MWPPHKSLRAFGTKNNFIYLFIFNLRPLLTCGLVIFFLSELILLFSFIALDINPSLHTLNK